nr:MAG: hypothetical protein DIU61_05020 [Bacteroidota bacterium]
MKEEPVRHIVVLKFKDGASKEKVQQITDAFASLERKIPGITSFEHGVNNSQENLNKGFTHVFMVTFENIKARDAYLPHPEHQKFVELLTGSGILEDLFVVDFSLKLKK